MCVYACVLYVCVCCRSVCTLYVYVYMCIMYTSIHTKYLYEYSHKSTRVYTHTRKHKHAHSSSLHAITHKHTQIHIRSNKGQVTDGSGGASRGEVRQWVFTQLSCPSAFSTLHAQSYTHTHIHTHTDALGRQSLSHISMCRIIQKYYTYKHTSKISVSYLYVSHLRRYYTYKYTHTISLSHLYVSYFTQSQTQTHTIPLAQNRT